MILIEIKLLTDIVPTIVGAIGAVLGIAGFIKSIRTEKKLHLEPYFKNVWPEISEFIEEINSDIIYYKNNLEFFFSNYDRYNILVNIEGSATPNLNSRRVYDIKKFDFGYSIKLKRMIYRSINKVRQVDNLIVKYNKDWYYAHNDFFSDIKNLDLAEYILHDTNAEDDKIKNEKKREEIKLQIRELEKRLKKYYKTTKIDNLVLKENSRYMKELKQLKQKIIDEVEKLGVDGNLVKLKEFYDKKFNSVHISHK